MSLNALVGPCHSSSTCTAGGDLLHRGHAGIVPLVSVRLPHQRVDAFGGQVHSEPREDGCRATPVGHRGQSQDLAQAEVGQCLGNEEAASRRHAGDDDVGECGVCGGAKPARVGVSCDDLHAADSTERDEKGRRRPTEPSAACWVSSPDRFQAQSREARSERHRERRHRSQAMDPGGAPSPSPGTHTMRPSLRRYTVPTGIPVPCACALRRLEAIDALAFLGDDLHLRRAGVLDDRDGLVGQQLVEPEARSAPRRGSPRR